MFGFIKNFIFGDALSTGSSSDSGIESTVNPATGLPMTNGMGSVDVAGNPYGTDLSHSSFSSGHDAFESSITSSNHDHDSWFSSSHDSWSSCSSDSWSSSSSDSWSSSSSSSD